MFYADRMSDLTTYEIEDGVATIAMDDGKANAFSPAMTAALNARSTVPRPTRRSSC